MTSNKFLYICPILITMCIKDTVTLPLGSDFSLVATKTVSINDNIVHDPEPYSNPTNIDNAQEEVEGPGSKILTIYEKTQSKVAGFLDPKPIVDTIREEDKYGNDGDKFYTINRAIVGGVEALSNLLNKLLDAPKELFKQSSRVLSDKLNAVGGKIVGL